MAVEKMEEPVDQPVLPNPQSVDSVPYTLLKSSKKIPES